MVGCRQFYHPLHSQIHTLIVARLTRALSSLSPMTSALSKEFDGQSARCPFCNGRVPVDNLVLNSDIFCNNCGAFLHFDGSEFLIHEQFNTAQAAQVCRIAQQTIIRCFENGSLKGYRAGDRPQRRIPRSALLEFMRKNQIPAKALGSG